MSAQRKQHEDLKKTVNSRLDKTDEGIANLGTNVLNKAAAATKEAEKARLDLALAKAEAEKQRAALEAKLALKNAEMEYREEMAKKKEEVQGALIATMGAQLADKEAALNHHRQMSAAHYRQTNSDLRTIRHQLDEAETKSKDNAADMMQKMEKLQLDLAALWERLKAQNDVDKESYELERVRLEKKLDEVRTSLHLLGQPGKLLQQVDKLKATSKEEHSRTLQAESEIANLEQTIKVLGARICRLTATTGSNGRKSRPTAANEAKELSAPTDHVDMGDAKAPATSSTRPILGNRDANTDADASAIATNAGSVQSVVKGASGDIKRRTTAREERDFASRTQGLLPPVQSMSRRTTRSTPCKPPRTPARKAATESKTPLRRSARKKT